MHSVTAVVVGLLMTGAKPQVCGAEQVRAGVLLEQPSEKGAAVELSERVIKTVYSRACKK